MGTVIRINMARRRRPDELAGIDLCYSTKDGVQHQASIRFEFKYLWEFGQDTDSAAFDFLVLAVIVYNVDRLLSRYIHSDDGWKRDITLEGVPARNADSMNAASNLFERSIGFLTGDKWTIHFVQQQPYYYNPPVNNTYNRTEYTKVALFSGGLDSLIGFIDEAHRLNAGEKMLLISHVEQGKEGADQNGILKVCRENNIYNDRYKRIKSGVSLDRNSYVNKEPSESTFRSRSLLFFAMGIYCAHSIDGYMQLIVPENGTISINVPLNPSRRSACSTRTTHPVFIYRLEEALRAIDVNNPLHNPYRLMSKADMVQNCCRDDSKNRIFRLLYKYSCSCAKRSHNFHWDKSSEVIERYHINHCGMCLPCIYRRVALDTIALDNADILGTDINNGTTYDLENLKQVRARDYRSLLHFLKRRMSESTIRKELKANHITSELGLDDYVSLVMRSYEQVISWVSKKGNRTAKTFAGIR